MKTEFKIKTYKEHERDAWIHAAIFGGIVAVLNIAIYLYIYHY